MSNHHGGDGPRQNNDGDQQVNRNFPGGNGERNYYRRYITSFLKENGKATRKDLEVKRFENANFQNTSILETTRNLCPNQDILFQAKVAEDVKQLLSQEKPRLLQSNSDAINNAAVGVLNHLIQNGEPAVKYLVRESLKKLVEKAPATELAANISSETIQGRNQDCGVPDQYGLREAIQEVSINSNTDIKPILVNIMARDILTSIYSGIISKR